MRLQLTVQRQGLPPVHVLWDTGALSPNHAPSGATTTVAQLLEQINEVIPLEAEEWGLEDYAVEVHAFECLHFCSLSILKEDDHVTVRPLQTSDLRYRRISGRHQISQDGKHLVDGVAFGRPFLRRSDRPPVRIPPRKRIRLTHDEEEDQDIAATLLNTDQRIIRSALNDADDEDSEDGGNRHSFGLDGLSDEGSGNVSDGDDGNYCTSEDSQEDLTQELHDLTQDMHSRARFEGVETMVSYDGAGEAPGLLTRARKRRKRNGLGLHGEGVLKLLEEGSDQFTGVYHNPLLDQYYQDEPAQSSNKASKGRRTQKARSRTSNLKVRQLEVPGGRSRQSSSVSVKSVRFDGDEVETPATIREVPGSESEDDGDFEPDDGQVSGSIGSNKENVQPSESGGDKVSSDKVDFGSSASGTESGSPDASSSSSSSSGMSLSASTSGSTSSSSSGSASSSSSGTPSSPELIRQSDQQSSGLRSNLRSGKETVAKKNKTSIPPGKGRRKTQKRNERRRVHKKLAHLKSIRILPSTATSEDYREYVERCSTEKCDSTEVDFTQGLDDTAEFDAKRKSLLESLASGGIDINPESKPNLESYNNDQDMEGYDAPDNGPGEDTAGMDEDHSRAAVATEAPDVIATPVIPPGTSEVISVSPESSKRRSRLDLASSRRLLFGSLGLRTPKNKEDETKLREKIMENAKPVFQVQEDKANGATADAVEELDNSWRDKIDLKAVECCYDGVELSTPPFPFVQRWDPQQKGRLSNGQGGQKTNSAKRRKRNQRQFYQEEEAESNNHHLPAGEPEIGVAIGSRQANEGTEHNRSLVHRGSSDTNQLAVDRQLLQDTLENTRNFTKSSDDIPNLPEDMTTCGAFKKELALPGAVIAFKQLDMSQETNWQPKVSEYRTAIINRVLEHNLYEVSLAQRDKPRKERLYDRDTGQRLYSKFEMPEYEDEDAENNDDCIVELSMADMIDPKLIKGVEIQTQSPHSSPPHGPENEYIDVPEVVGGDAPDPEAPMVGNMSKDLANTGVFIGPELPTTEPAEDLPVRIREGSNKDEPYQVNEETRQEISLIIKDAGFRSNVYSDLERGFEGEVHPPSPKEDMSEGVYVVRSPKFNGFSSSPPAEESSRQALEDPGTTVRPTTYRMSSTNIIDMESSEPNEPVEASEELLDDKVDEDWEAGQLEDDGSAYPALPGYSDTEEQDRRGSAKVDTSSSASPKTVQRMTSSTKGRGFMSRTRALFSAFDGADSDGDLPTMESVFSTARSRIDEAIPDSDDAKEHEADEPKLQSGSKSKKVGRTINRFPQRTIPVFSVDDVLASSSSASQAEIEEPDAALSSGGSQPPAGPQVVDLTLSSDPVEPDGSEYEERNGVRGMPRGPGWVQKTRSAGKGRRLQPKAGGRKTRSM